MTRTTLAPSEPGTAQQLAYTSYLRVVSIVGVVFIHVAGLTYIREDLHGSPVWWLAAAMDFGFKWAVPVFVMVSGALVLRPPVDRSAGTFYRRRLHRIGIPLVVWHAVYIVLLVTVVSPGVSARSLGASFLRGQTYTALYFFWLILGLYALVPLLWPLVTVLHRRQLAVAGAALAALPALDLSARGMIGLLRHKPPEAPDLTLVTQFLPYVGFFLLGYALRDVVVRGRALAVVALAWLLLVTELVLQVTVLDRLPRSGARLLEALSPVTYQGWGLGLSAIAVFVLVRGMVHPRSSLAQDGPARRMRRLGDLTLGVFASHLLVLALVSRLPAVDLVRGAGSVGSLLLLNGSIVVIAFALTAVLARVPLLRRAV